MKGLTLADVHRHGDIQRSLTLKDWTFLYQQPETRGNMLVYRSTGDQDNLSLETYSAFRMTKTRGTSGIRTDTSIVMPLGCFAAAFRPYAPTSLTEEGV